MTVHVRADRLTIASSEGGYLYLETDWTGLLPKGEEFDRSVLVTLEENGDPMFRRVRVASDSSAHQALLDAREALDRCIAALGGIDEINVATVLAGATHD